MFDQAIELVRKYAEADGDKVKLTCGEVDKSLYKRFDELMKRFRGQWKGGKTSAHIFPEPITGQIVIDSVLAGNIPGKNPYDLFPSPDHVVDEIRAEVNHFFPDKDEELLFLEPNGGTGAIAKMLRDEYPNATIHVIEIDPVNRRILERQGFTLVHDNALTYETDARYDAVVMNPPFNGAEYIKHIEKALSVTERHGVTISVAPESMMNSSQASVMRLLDRIYEAGSEIIDLPEGSFKGSGTDVDTVLFSIPGDWVKTIPYEGYASRKVALLSVIAQCDQGVDRKINGLAEKYKKLKVDKRGLVENDDFRGDVKEIYQSYMNENRRIYFVILSDWEWDAMASDVAEMLSSEGLIEMDREEKIEEIRIVQMGMFQGGEIVQAI